MANNKNDAVRTSPHPTALAFVTFRINQSIFKLLVIIVMLGFLQGCSVLFSRTYSSPKIEITIVNAVTGNPVEDAIIVANWPLLSTGYAGGGVPAGSLALFEVVSNENGVFKLPSWGPAIAAGDTRVDGNAPIIRIFKHGYEYLELRNEAPYPPPAVPPSIFTDYENNLGSRWNSQIIELVPFIGTDSEYAKQIEWLESSLDDIVSRQCLGASSSKMKLAVNALIEDFRQKNIRYRLSGFMRECDGSGKLILGN